jgi:hypothetical protein
MKRPRTSTLPLVGTSSDPTMGGFPRTAGTDQSGELARSEGEVDIAEGGDRLLPGGIRLDQVGGANQDLIVHENLSFNPTDINSWSFSDSRRA